MDAKSEAVMKSDSSSSSKAIVLAETSSSVRVSKQSISSKEIVATQLISGTYKSLTDGIGNDDNDRDSLQMANPSVLPFPNVSSRDGHISGALLAGHRSQSMSSTVSSKPEDAMQNVQSELLAKSQSLEKTGTVTKEDGISNEGDNPTENKSIQIEEVVDEKETIVEEKNGKEAIEQSETEESAESAESSAESSADEVDNGKTEFEKEVKATGDGNGDGDVSDVVSTKTIQTQVAPIIKTTPPTPSNTDVSNPIANDTEDAKSNDAQEGTAGELVESANNEEEEDEESEVEEQSQNTKVAEVDKDQVDKAGASARTTRQVELNNQIKDIISDIDSNIIEQEKIAQLKQQELELIRKQQELAKQIEQQQKLANQLAVQNQLRQQELQEQQIRSSIKQPTEQQQHVTSQSRPEPQSHSQSQPSPQTNSSKYETFEETQNENGYTRKSELFKAEESSNVSKTIDLRKIFTPATDAPEIIPKNRKLYASSAFYSPSLHPTVEDQVELARRISHSLSDISNQTSKGQSMYVNRKKRSVKWVHEGSGQANIGHNSDHVDDVDASKENQDEDSQIKRTTLDKLPLKLVMNPRGQMRDYNSLSETLNIETGLLSPDNCAELILALQLQKGRGAELFAKRRRKAENWVVDETNAGTQSPSGIPDYQQYQPKPSVSPSLLPAYSDAGKHRVQLNMHQEQMIEKYAKPGLKVVKSPWEAALETGSASTAFVESQKLRSHTPTPVVALSPAPVPQYCPSPSSFGTNLHGSTTSYGYPKTPTSHQTTSSSKYELPQPQYEQRKPSPVNPQRDLAYKPNIPQGWRAPNVELPKDYQRYGEISEYHDFDGLSECESLTHVQHLTLHKENVSDVFEDFKGKSNYERKGSVARRSQLQDFVLSCDNSNENINFNENSKPQIPCYERVEDSSMEKIDVQKQLQYFEENQRRAEQQQLNERIFLERREQERLLRKQRQEKIQQHQQMLQPSAGSIKETNGNIVLESKKEKLEEVAEYVETVGDYVKVPVRDLISSFEQQSLAEAQQVVLQPRRDQILCVESTFHPYHDRQLQEECKSDTSKLTCSDEGLYVPKEIPLDSYAPPPVCSPIQSQNVQNYSPSWTANYRPVVNEHQPSQTVSTPAAPRTTFPYGDVLSSGPTGFNAPKSGGFPLSQPVKTNNYSGTVPPKQQLYAPTSYQKVAPNTNNGAPPVSFNPSPISYEKLSKFENPTSSSQDNVIYSPQRHLNVRGSSKVRNLSPTPFSGARSPGSYGTLTPQTSSPRPLSQQFNTNHNFGYDADSHAHSFTTSNYHGLGQATSFNKTARGWGGVGPGPNQRICSAQAADISALPYSDF